MSKRLEAAQRETAINEGLVHFCRATPAYFDCEANTHLLVSEIEKKNLPLNALSSWQQAFETQKANLATPVVERPAPVRTREEEWPYKFPDFRGSDGRPNFQIMNRLLPGRTYRDHYFEKLNGELTQSALDFRRLTAEAIALENQKRAGGNHE
jgi:hypothetical protein